MKYLTLLTIGTVALGLGRATRPSWRRVPHPERGQRNRDAEDRDRRRCGPRHRD